MTDRPEITNEQTTGEVQPNSRHADLAARHVISSVERLSKQQEWIILDGKTIRDAGILHLATLLEEKGPLLKTLSIAQCRLTDASIPFIARILEDCPNLENLDLSRNTFSAAGIETLIDDLQKHPSLQNIDFSRIALGSKGGTLLETLLSSPPPALREIHMDAVGLADSGMVQAANALRKAPAITRVSLIDNQARDLGGRALAEWIAENPDIAIAHLSQQIESTDTRVAEAFNAAKGRNLISASPANALMKPWMERNLRVATIAANYLRQPPESLSYFQLATASAVESAAFAQYGNGPTHTTPSKAKSRYDAYLAQMPGLPPAGKDFEEALFRPNKAGFAPLDNPHIWQQPEEVFARLEASEAKLTTEFRERKTAKGINFVESAAAAMPLEKLLKPLNQKAIQLGQETFLHEGKPSALLQALIEREDVQPLFNKHNWYGKGMREARTIYDVIPAELQEDISINTLAEKIRPKHGSGRYEKPQFEEKGFGRG